ncbi:PaREP1 family protein [Vulcanisaeta distributa]|uniref:PaREP1 family protein n=1 Tax=Vulcanisaeta distributa TaxID=164451 RepID=UPI0006D02138|nr:PaREP1 family protein [Vulcanisaeta distributa]
MALVLSPTIAELLRELAGGRDIEEFIIDIVTERLDPPRKFEVYLKLSEDYLKAADELYNKGDLAQAGEKYWGGAVTALLNAIAEQRDWEHYSHRDYDVIIGRLYKETKDKSILTNFSMAERLHTNFHHKFMDRKEFEAHRKAVFELIGKLREFLKNLNKT